MIDNQPEVQEHQNDICSIFLVILSYLAVICFPLSLIYCLKVVQEYERAVKFLKLNYNQRKIKNLILGNISFGS